MKAEKIAILALKPAQIAVGLLEVEHRMKDFAAMTRDEFHSYSEAHPVPVVKSDHGYYIIDHHHLCRAFHELGHHMVTMIQQADFSQLPRADFWRTMESASWVLPQDQFGALHPYNHLPMDVRGMADDPYRSLVWALKEQGAWKKSAVPFSEFVLANFLRDKVSIDNTLESFEAAVKAAAPFLKEALTVSK